jgi:hypothetical protein
MWSSGFTRINRYNRKHFTQLFTTGSCPESKYELKPNPHTPVAVLPRTIANQYPQAEMWGLYGAHSTVVVKLPTTDSVLWVMRNGDNRGSCNLSIFYGEDYYSRTNILQIMQLINILTMDRDQLPLLIGAVDPANMRTFEKRMKG